jgi:hypothetical protein
MTLDQAAISTTSQFLGNLSGLIIAPGMLVIASAYRAGIALSKAS